MSKVTISRVHNGVKSMIFESEISKEQSDKITAKFSKLKENSREKMQNIYDKIPAINWEILKYSNNHEKKDVLAKYPEHEKFINTINY